MRHRPPTSVLCISLRIMAGVLDQSLPASRSNVRPRDRNASTYADKYQGIKVRSMLETVQGILLIVSRLDQTVSRKRGGCREETTTRQKCPMLRQNAPPYTSTALGGPELFMPVSIFSPPSSAGAVHTRLVLAQEKNLQLSREVGGATRPCNRLSHLSSQALWSPSPSYSSRSR